MAHEPHRRARRPREGQRGAVAVEFALVLPILLLLVFGIIDFGYMLNRDTMINNVSRDAARVASLGGTYAEISSTATSELAQYGIPASKTQVTITCAKDPAASCIPYDAQKASGDSVTVKIVYTHGWITPTMSTFLPNTITLTKQTSMRIE